MWDTVGEVCVQTSMHCNHFPIQHFVWPYTCNLKTTGCIRMFYISTDCSTIADVCFCVRAGWKIRTVSYASKHALQSLSNKPFVRILDNFRSYVDVQHIEQLLYHRIHSLCGLELQERFDRRATALDTHRSFWYKVNVCVYCKPVHTLLFDTQLCLPTKFT